MRRHTAMKSNVTSLVAAMFVAAISVAGCNDEPKPVTTTPTAAATPVKTAEAAPTPATAATAAPAGAHKYVGVKACSKCHKSEKIGNQFAKWQEMGHSKAFKTLQGDKAKEAGKKVGVDDPSKSDKCLKCHVTAFGVDKGLIEADFDPQDGIQCESCHGPGGDYRKKSIMKDKEQAKKNGLIMPDEAVCVKCHNKESPFYKEFDFKKFAAKIAHPVPKGAKDDKGDDGD